MTDKEFIEKLEKINYFEYAVNNKIALIKDVIKNNLKGHQVFLSAINEKPPYQSYDLRFYDCGDGEELFEEGGAIDLLKEMQPLFAKLKVHLNYQDDLYTGSLHTLKVNGNTYTLAQGSMLGWGETFVAFAEMINSELKAQNNTEQIYLLMYDDSAYMTFLTTEQLDLINRQVSFDKRFSTPKELTAKLVSDMHNL